MMMNPELPTSIEDDFETGPWTVEEIDLLADEAEEMISFRESQGYQ